MKHALLNVNADTVFVHRFYMPYADVRRGLLVKTPTYPKTVMWVGCTALAPRARAMDLFEFTYFPEDRPDAASDVGLRYRLFSVEHLLPVARVAHGEPRGWVTLPKPHDVAAHLMLRAAREVARTDWVLRMPERRKVH